MSARDTMEYKEAIAEAKEEILAGLTGEGGLGETSQEILDKVTNGVEMSAKVPISVGSAHKTTSANDMLTVCEISGKGKAKIASEGYVTIIVDGVTVAKDTQLWGLESGICLEFEFVKSFVAKYRKRIDGTSTSGQCVCRATWQLF